MKKLVGKFMLVVLALVLATGIMTAHAFSVVREVHPDNDDRGYDAQQRSFALEGYLTEAAYFIIEHDGTSSLFYPAHSGINGHVVAYEGGFSWGEGNMVPGAIFEEGRIIFPLGAVVAAGTTGADPTHIRVGLWDGGATWESGAITRMFVANPGVAAVTPVPIADGIGGAINPQTGDTFTTTGLIVTGVGLVSAIAALIIIFKKR
jgi:LPXTG-motif cell wall-anchored protein